MFNRVKRVLQLWWLFLYRSIFAKVWPFIKTFIAPSNRLLVKNGNKYIIGFN